MSIVLGEPYTSVQL